MVRFERTTNDDCRTLHVLDEVLRVACMLVHAVHTVLENLSYDVSNLQELELALFKFYKNLNWSLHYSKSKGLGDFRIES